MKMSAQAQEIQELGSEIQELIGEHYESPKILLGLHRCFGERESFDPETRSLSFTRLLSTGRMAEVELG
jgi:hypothetical protein